MSTVLPFASNNITINAYETFSYTISNPDAGAYTLSIAKSSGIPTSYLVNNANFEVNFSAPSNGMNVGTQSFTVSALVGSNVVATSSNTVTIAAGRFTVIDGISFLPRSNFAFYAKETIAPIRMFAPFFLSPPTSTPTLPPGLSFSTPIGTEVTILGTPLTTSPQSNYLIIAKEIGSSKVASSTISMVISNERVVTNISPSDIVSNMTIGTAIVPRVITARGNGVIRYNWNSFPDGIYATDYLGSVVLSGFEPVDASFTLIVAGAPTLSAANAFASAQVSSVTQNIGVTRVVPAPLITSVIPVTFSFAETVLFDTATIPAVYTGVPIPLSSAYSFRAATYFSNVGGVTSIFSPDLRSDLSLSFVPAESRAYLTGTPLSAGTGSYTIRAANNTPTTRDLTSTITVLDDTVTFVSPTPAVDVCYNFVVSRPANVALTGYYPAPVTFAATAASGNSILWSASALAGTGLALDVSGNTATISGTPTAIAPLQTLGVRADVSGTPATATRNVKFEVLNDIITLAALTALQTSFIQNKPITPIQLSATALSGRAIVSFSATGLPLGLTITPTGLISGTPTVSTGTSFMATATTGFASGSREFFFTTIADSILLVERPQPSYALTPGGPLPPATVSGLSYSGINVSNFVFSNLLTTYGTTFGMTIGNTTGIFGGTLTTSFPPDVLLISNVNFSVQASAGSLTATLPAQLNTSNAPRFRWYIARGTDILNATETPTAWTSIPIVDDPLAILGSNLTDYSIRPVTLTERVIVGVTNTNEYVQSLDGTTLTEYLIPPTPYPFNDPNPSAPPPQPPGYTMNLGPNVIVSVPSSSTIYGAGVASGPAQNIASFWKSTDDGLTWTGTFPVYVPGLNTGFYLSTALLYGSAIAYKSGVILIGGAALNSSVVRSVDGGASWSITAGYGDNRWVSALNTEADRWILAGGYGPYSPWTDSTPAITTLFYSDDQGQNWTAATSGDFNYRAEYVAYGNGLWIAGGLQGDIGGLDVYFGLRYSTDGLTWTSFTLRDDPFLPAVPVGIQNNFLDSINYDGEKYNVVVTYNNDDTYTSTIYRHATGSSLLTGWTPISTDIYSYPGKRTRKLLGRYPIALAPPTPVLFFPNQTGGPVITSPTSSSILLYQYVAMSPIVFAATGTGTIYFFVLESELPDGLTFNSVTNTLSGTPARAGISSITFYAKDNVGSTPFTLTIRVILASVTRRQDGAGAYTSLVRQYTEVNAAETARDNRALPAIEYRLGEFTSPQPPSVITAPSDCPC